MSALAFVCKAGRARSSGVVALNGWTLPCDLFGVLAVDRKGLGATLLVRVQTSNRRLPECSTRCSEAVERRSFVNTQHQCERSASHLPGS